MARQVHWLLLCCAVLIADTAAAPTATGPAAKTLADAAKQNNLKMVLTAVQQVPAAARVFADPEAKCTMFAPTDKGYRESLQQLGPKVGLVAQNRSMMSTIVQHHLLPEALSAKELKGKSRVLSMSNETVFLHTDKKGQLWVYSNFRYPIQVETTDIKAGGCFLHIISNTIVPPSLMETLEGWSNASGNFPKLPPKSEWAPVQAPLAGTPKPVSILDAAANGSTAGSGSTAMAPAAAVPAAGGDKKSSDAQHKVLHALAGGVALVAMLLV